MTWLLLVAGCLVVETVVIVALGRQVTSRYDAEHRDGAETGAIGAGGSPRG
jgi:hypothetical protein